MIVGGAFFRPQVFPGDADKPYEPAKSRVKHGLWR